VFSPGSAIEAEYVEQKPDQNGEDAPPQRLYGKSQQ
jgi:hypothetical protein